MSQSPILSFKTKDVQFIDLNIPQGQEVTKEAEYATKVNNFFENKVPHFNRLKGLQINGSLKQLVSDLTETQIKYVSSKTSAIPGVEDSEVVVYDDRFTDQSFMGMWLVESNFQLEGLPKKYQTVRSIYFALAYQAPNRLDARSLKIVETTTMGGSNLDLDNTPHLLSIQTTRADFEKIFVPYPLNKTDNHLYSGKEEIIFVPHGDEDAALVMITEAVARMASQLAVRFARNLEKVYKGF